MGPAFRHSINQIFTALAAELLIASVINSKDVDAVATISFLGYEVNGESCTRGIKEDRRKKLQEILDKSPCTQDSIRVVFRTGHPLEELLKLTLGEDVDLIKRIRCSSAAG